MSDGEEFDIEEFDDTLPEPVDPRLVNYLEGAFAAVLTVGVAQYYGVGLQPHGLAVTGSIGVLGFFVYEAVFGQ